MVILLFHNKTHPIRLPPLRVRCSLTIPGWTVGCNSASQRGAGQHFAKHCLLGCEGNNIKMTSGWLHSWEKYLPLSHTICPGLGVKPLPPRTPRKFLLSFAIKWFLLNYVFLKWKIENARVIPKENGEFTDEKSLRLLVQRVTWQVWGGQPYFLPLWIQNQG